MLGMFEVLASYLAFAKKEVLYQCHIIDRDNYSKLFDFLGFLCILAANSRLIQQQ